MCMKFIDFMKLMKRRFWIILMVTMIATASSFVISQYYLVPVYANSTTLLVLNGNENHPENPISSQFSLTFNDVLLYEKLLGTYRDIILSKTIREDAVKRFNETHHDSFDADHLLPLLTVSTSSNSQMITITVKHENYITATNLANATAVSFSDNLKKFLPVNNVQVVDRAELQSHPKPISPNKIQNVVIAFMLGIMSSTSIVLLLHFLDTRVRTEEDFIGVLEYPILGIIPNYNKRVKKPPFYKV